MSQLLHLVIGGRVQDPQGLEFVDLKALDYVGVYGSYAEAVDDIATRLLAIHARHIVSEMHNARDELAAGLRSWPTSTPYLLFYFVDADGITIARVLHHARDVPAIRNWPRH